MRSSFWTRVLRKPREVELEFELDMDADERHVISVFEKHNGARHKVLNPAQLWSYGRTFKRAGIRYSLSFKAVESLNILRSLHPATGDDGDLLIKFLPPALEYLRKRKDVKETATSSKLKVSEEHLEPSAVVDYNPAEGTTITAGYRRSADDHVVRKSELDLTHDGGYARFGDVFHPLKKTKSDKGAKWIEEETTTIDLDHVPEFFSRDLVLLKSELSAVLTDQAQRVQIISAPLKPRVTVEQDEPGWLDFVVDYKAGRYVLPEDTIKRTLKDGKTHVRVNEYRFIKADQGALDRTQAEIKKLGAVSRAKRYRLPITRFSSLEEFIDRIGGARVLSKAYEDFLAKLSGFKPNEDFRLSDTAEKNLLDAGFALRPYQRAGIHWLNWLRENHLHGVLADDMGLGKTVQTICAVNIAHEKQEADRPSLIVCPRSVVPFWVREVRRCVPDINISAYGGSRRDKTIWENGGKRWIVTTYETLARDIDLVAKVPFYFLVLDEATMIKNPHTQRTQAIKSINAMHRLAISGTPVENRLSELWSMFDFLIKGMFGTHGDFSTRYEAPIAAGDEDAAEELARRIRPFLLRRLKETVAKDLPEKLELEIWCDLTAEQRSLYGQLQDLLAKPLQEEIESGAQVNYQMSVLPVLTKLKQVCDHPALITGKLKPLLGRSEKFDTTVARIQEIKAAGEQVVVFSHFLKTLDLFELVFADLGISSIRIDGGVENRQERIDHFNKGKATVALCSILACGYGITLTSANHVIHFDRWWNPATEDQATDRVHRIGQQKTVYVYRTLVSGTLEEKIAVLLENKRNLADQVIGASITQPMSWTKQELLELLKPLD
jgi:SNF2 family DNA or RNA helicase